jgi:hypothetical protein
MNVSKIPQLTRALIISSSLAMVSFAASGQSMQPMQSSGQAGTLPQNSAGSLQPMLAQIDQSAQQAALDIAKLRIEKWKADGNSKQQAQANAESLQRNLTNALPGMTSAVRAAPQSLAPAFKLYRNLSALYDVLTGLAESAGAFGPQQDFDALKQQTEAFDNYRRSLGDYLESLTAQKDADLAHAVRAQQQAPAVVPKKIISDEDTPPPPAKKKTAKKKKTTTPPSQ